MKKGRLLLTSSTLWYIIPTLVWLPNRLVSGTAPKDGSLGGAGPQLLTLAATCTSSKKIRPRIASIATHACFFPTGMANSLKNLAGNSTRTPTYATTSKTQKQNCKETHCVASFSPTARINTHESAPKRSLFLGPFLSTFGHSH